MKFEFKIMFSQPFGNPFKHECSFVHPIAARALHVPAMEGMFMGRSPERDMTATIFRCKCGAVAEKKLEGQWTIEDLRGDRLPTKAAVDALLESTKK